MAVLWFSGDTKPNKDEIKALGYYWGEKTDATEKDCWHKTVKFDKVKEEIKKAESIGAKLQKGDKERRADENMNYAAALKKQKKWKEEQQKLNDLEKPRIPDVIDGKKWNCKIYGKPGKLSIYPDGEQTYITDDEAEELREYLKLQEEYKKKVEEIKNV